MKEEDINLYSINLDDECFDIRQQSPKHGDKVIIYLANDEEKEAIYFEYMSGIYCFLVESKPDFKARIWSYPTRVAEIRALVGQVVDV